MKIRINTSNNATAVNIKDRWSSNINVFSLVESAEHISIVYDSNACFCNDDIPTNSVITIDMKRDLLDGATAFVKEWLLRSSVPCNGDHYTIVDSVSGLCTETF